MQQSFRFSSFCPWGYSSVIGTTFKTLVVPTVRIPIIHSNKFTRARILLKYPIICFGGRYGGMLLHIPFRYISLSVRPSIRKLVLPDWQTLHDELISHKHLTLMLLWQEYKADSDVVEVTVSESCCRPSQVMRYEVLWLQDRCSSFFLSPSFCQSAIDD